MPTDMSLAIGGITGVRSVNGLTGDVVLNYDLRQFVVPARLGYAMAQVANARAACSGSPNGPGRCHEFRKRTQHTGRDKPARDQCSHQGNDSRDEEKRSQQ